MKFFYKLLLAALVFPAFCFSNNIQLTNVSFSNESGIVQFDLTWENAWMNEKNHDAAWVFVKFIDKDGSYIHGNLAASPHEASNNFGPTMEVQVSKDRIGAFIVPLEYHRGAVIANFKLKIDTELLKRIGDEHEVRVYAIEMVYIPEGAFYVGSTEQEAIDYASFYQSDASGEPAGPYRIASEDETIKVGKKAGDLYYKTGDSPYRGDQSGVIPAEFPKGYKAFYIMKYETTQGLYADFLNAIHPELAAALSPHTIEGYYDKKGCIRFENGTYRAYTYDRPANFITWDDGMAFADWAGLRPMTEFEFTKAARGPELPIAHGFPWGTDSTDKLKRVVTLDDELVLLNGLSEKQLADATRPAFGASYYWVMDLAGSLWEKCVTIGHHIGRAYKGTHGDGILSSQGTATNPDWPKGISEEGGYGYRGGGYYDHDMKVSDYNPHSPTSYRPYGSWAGGDRSIAYSQRLVRTVD